MKAIYNFSIVISVLAVGFAEDSTNDYEVLDVSDVGSDIAATEGEHSDISAEVVNVRLGQIVPRHLCHRAIRNTQVTAGPTFCSELLQNHFVSGSKQWINFGCNQTKECEIPSIYRQLNLKSKIVGQAKIID